MTKNKGGRPKTDFSNLLESIQEHAAKGLPLDTIAYLVGSSPTTFKRHKRQNIKIQEAIAKGRAKHHKELVEKLDKHIDDGNLAGLLFKLKAFYGYRDNSHAPPEEKSKPVAKVIKYSRKENGNADD